MMKVSHTMSALRRSLAGALLVVVCLAVFAICSAINGPVRVVRVSGDLSGAERAEVEAAVLAQLDGGLIGISLDAVVDGVLSLRWPRDVQARRVFPGVIDVSVAKDAIVARWGELGTLNSAGEVIEGAGTPDPSLPLIRCANASGARAMEIFQMLGQVLRHTPLKIASVEEDALGEWEVTFSNNLTVSLGHEDLLARTERFLRVFEGVINDQLDQVERVDARYRNGVAVDWRAPRVGQSGGAQLAAVVRTNGRTN
jgi:cell division protein FtsQ